MISDYLKQELRSAWSAVFLDGRNEYGTHVLALPQGMISDRDLCPEDYAEEIMKAAEEAGHVAGDAVVVTWRWVQDDHDHFELLAPYHADLTAIIFGTPYEQKRNRDTQETLAEQSAADWL